VNTLLIKDTRRRITRPEAEKTPEGGNTPGGCKGRPKAATRPEAEGTSKGQKAPEGGTPKGSKRGGK